jgi:hypothetical protein
MLISEDLLQLLESVLNSSMARWKMTAIVKLSIALAATVVLPDYQTRGS